MWVKIICLMVGLAAGALAASYISGYAEALENKNGKQPEPDSADNPDI